MPKRQTSSENPVVDAQELGRRIRAARVLAGIESVVTVTQAVRALGLVVSDRTLYAIERGEQPVPYDLLVALVAVLEPPGGLRFMWPSIRPDLLDVVTGLAAESDREALDRAATRAFIAGRSQVAQQQPRRKQA